MNLKDKLKMSNLEIAINGVKIASKILNIPEPEVYFISSDNLPNKEITAIFLFDEYEIPFNEDWVMSVPWIEVMVTCFHESRHAYQAHSINNEVNENDKTLTLWKKEFDSYNNPSGDNTPISDVSYLRQSIEVDAIRFAHDKIKELFNVKTIVPDEMKDLVFKKL